MGEIGGVGKEPLSEWQPARQKMTCNIPLRSDKVRWEDQRINWKSVWGNGKRQTTFFFKNFPDTCSVKELSERFKEIGVVLDLFVPKKKGNDGINYGFVRFGENIDKLRAERSLNEMWFGSYKLRANISKFVRGTHSQRLRVERVKPKHIVQRQAWRKEDMSYAKSLGGHNKVVEEKSFAGYRYSPKPANKDFARRCFSGVLKEEYSWGEVGILINELCGENIRASYTGGDFVIFHPVGEGRISLNDLDCFQEWFELIREWSENDMNHRRSIWTKWYGVPLHAWNSKFFSLMVTKFGQMIMINAETLEKRCLLRARVLIRTSLPKIPRTPFPVMIEDKIYYIRIVEEDEDWIAKKNDQIVEVKGVDAEVANVQGKFRFDILNSVVGEEHQAAEIGTQCPRKETVNSTPKPSSGKEQRFVFQSKEPCNSNLRRAHQHAGSSKIAPFRRPKSILTRSEGGNKFNGSILNHVGPPDFISDPSPVFENIHQIGEPILLKAVDSEHSLEHIRSQPDLSSEVNQLLPNCATSEMMETGFDSPEKNSEISTGISSPNLPSSIVEVKKLARFRKKKE